MAATTHADQPESIEHDDSITDEWELSLWDALMLNTSRTDQTRTAAVARVIPIESAGSTTALKAVA